MAGQHDNGAGDSRPQATGPRATGEQRGIADFGGLLIAVALFLFAAMIAWDASTYPARGGYAQIGPEIFPYVVATGIAIFGVLTVIMARRGDFPARDELYLPPVLWIIGALVAQIALLFGGSGFIIASGALFGGAARGFGRKPLALTFLVGVVVSSLLYILFRHGLGLSLPAGLIEPYIDALWR
jgi:putative tricarboxylic transport membrane protein